MDVGLREVAGNERQEPGLSQDEPVYVPIGPGWNGSFQDGEDDAGWGPRPLGLVQVALAAAVRDWLRSVRTVRFWLLAAGVPVATSAAAWVLLAAAIVPREDPHQAGGLFWVYLLAAAFMPATSVFLAAHWGVAGLHRLHRHRAPAPRDPGPLAVFLAVAGRGLVVAALALLLLLVHARLAGVSDAMAGVAAGVVALEFAVFGAVGAGVSALLRRRLWAALAGWGVAAAFVVGNAAAFSALLPAVRTEEPVAVAMNVQWGPARTRLAYDCAPLLERTADVFHTERIAWLLASNPVVMFVMFADNGGSNDEGPAWVPAALQEAADGTRVPCVNAEHRSKDAEPMPMGLVGLATQSALAGAFLIAGQLAARRRTGSAG